MSWVIIGGLITSTLLARLVTPVMYKLIPPSISPRLDSKETHSGGTTRVPGRRTSGAGYAGGALTRE